MKPLVGLTLLFAFGAAAVAAEQAISLPVTQTHQRLVVALWTGNITIVPGTAVTVGVAADCEPQDSEASTVDSNFRSLRASSVLPDIVSGDEVITIRTYEEGPQCSLSLQVPEGMELHTRINRSGSINVEAWRGRLQAWSAEGDVNVINHSGSLSVTAMSGDASVSLADDGIDADSAISAANGTLTLTVNEENVPALRAQARWGDVQTNLDVRFDEVVENGRTWFVATAAGNSAPVLTLRNLNRDVVIRKAGTSHQ